MNKICGEKQHHKDTTPKTRSQAFRDIILRKKTFVKASFQNMKARGHIREGVRWEPHFHMGSEWGSCGRSGSCFRTHGCIFPSNYYIMYNKILLHYNYSFIG